MSIRTYLIVVTSMLVLSLCAGVYVWRVYQSVQEEKSSIEEGGASIPPRENREERNPSTTPAVETSTEATPYEPVTLNASMLNEEQRAILESFGMGDAHVTITDVEYSCIEKALGKSRLGEVIQGAAPSPLEAVRIAACLTK